MRYHVQVGTTSILHRDLNELRQTSLQTAIEGAGYVRDPTITSQLLTRRLVMSAYIDSEDAGGAMAIGKSVLLSHLYEHGPEYRRVGIHHTDATPGSGRRPASPRAPFGAPTRQAPRGARSTLEGVGRLTSHLDPRSDTYRAR